VEIIVTPQSERQARLQNDAGVQAGRWCMDFAYSARIRVGILLIVFFSLLSSYRLFVQWVQLDLSFVGLDEITQNEKRFDEIKASLPSHGVVGYWPNGSPATLEQLMFGNAGDLKHWLLTQYALAPVIVSPTLGHSTIVSNSRITPDAGLSSGKRFVEDGQGGRKVRDFGNGVMLITRELE
jgi:hypothetical protein